MGFLVLFDDVQIKPLLCSKHIFYCTPYVCYNFQYSRPAA